MLTSRLAMFVFGTLFGSAGFNGTLILLGALGVLPPAVSALLHNSSTLLLSMHSLTKLMDEEKTNKLERTHTNGNRSIQ